MVRKAAVQGHADAQYNLGAMYAQGNGVPQDYVRAYMWWSLSAANSTSDAQKVAADNRDSVAARMTAAQLVEAQQLLQQCQSRSSMAA